MVYEIVAVDEENVVVWDQVTKDPKTGKMAGLMTLGTGPGPQTYRVGEKVHLILAYASPKEE